MAYLGESTEESYNSYKSTRKRAKDKVLEEICKEWERFGEKQKKTVKTIINCRTEY